MLQKWTDNDSYIMEDAIQAGYKGKALAAINRCRLYMKAVTTSDISSIQGDEITADSFNVNREENEKYGTSSLEYDWQHQVRPVSADRTRWRQFLEKVYHINRNNRQWESPCGIWLQQAATLAEWLIDESDRLVYERLHHTTDRRVWTPARRRRATSRYTIHMQN